MNSLPNPVRVERSRDTSRAVSSTAISNGLPVYTRNVADFAALEGLVEILAI